MKKHLPLLLRLLGPILLIIFLINADLGKLWLTLRETTLWPVILSLLLMPPFVLIKSWRWVRLMREMGISLDLPTANALYTVGLFYGATTPGQAGDLLKAVYLHERGNPLPPAMLSVVLDRLFDLLIMAALGTLGIFALGQLLPSRELQTALVVLMGIGLAILTTVLLARGPRQWTLTVLLARIAPKLTATLNRWNSQLSSLTLSSSLLSAVILASLVSAGFTFVRLWLLFLALGLDLVPLYVVIGASALIAVLQVLPISIAGVGVRDAVLIAIIMPYGYSTEQALTLSALFLLLNIEHIVVGFIVSFWYPLGRGQTQLEM
ncbi:lysylphosphatidylglycerol synthase transmembrane domain-containing protein [Candidatus Viridilinea mediisalina]|uniref:TIGR00374 family protein n=1 Tax=Candidatus Viridilinea mediisalina TaxID=2024553 RepID=A0A2A6RMQ0_9CHLR|nr:lysylphosphatidylglycerol synthase transmembrane domain-containing protein [Candidatus Viridilinea mediisalina]PDW04364.1 TIGR00374 family protein [Candidatus Viridilinea mediisalina]